MSKLRKVWRTYTLIIVIGVVIFVLYLLKNAHFCPQGTIWTGAGCNGMGLIIPTP